MELFSVVGRRPLRRIHHLTGGGGAMHLRVAREVEWSCSGSGGSVSGLLGVLYAPDRRGYKSAGPVPAPPVHHAPTNQAVKLTL